MSSRARIRVLVLGVVVVVYIGLAAWVLTSVVDGAWSGPVEGAASRIAPVLGIAPGFVRALGLGLVLVPFVPLVSALDPRERLLPAALASAVVWGSAWAVRVSGADDDTCTHRLLATAGVVALFLLSCLVAAFVAVLRRGRGRSVRRFDSLVARIVGVALSLVYGTIVAVVTLQPMPVTGEADDVVWAWVQVLHGRGVPEWLDTSAAQWLANIALFVPLGTVVTLIVGRRHWLVALAFGVGVSIAVELAQGVLLPGRYADLGDVVANSTGSVIGCLGAVVALALVTRSAPEPGEAGGAARDRGRPEVDGERRTAHR